MPFQETLSYEDVAAKLAYDPVTGAFTWLEDVGKNVKAGSQAGTVKVTRITGAGRAISYRYIRLHGRTMLAGRLAWLLHYRVWPAGRVAPKNEDTLDLRIDNLEESGSLPGRYDMRNPEERKQYHRDNRAAQPLALKERELQRSFGVELQTYMRMNAAQGNVCAICKQEETVTRNGRVKLLAVDHNHMTGAIRDLLCQNCNQMVGFSKEEPATLRAAADYIERHRAQADNVVALKPNEEAG